MSGLSPGSDALLCCGSAHIVTVGYFDGAEICRAGSTPVIKVLKERPQKETNENGDRRAR